MKTARLLFTMICCGALAALTLGFASGTPPAASRTRPQTSSDRTPDEKHRAQAQSKGQRIEGGRSEGKQGEARAANKRAKAGAKPAPPSLRPNLHSRDRDPKRRDHPRQRPVGIAQAKSVPMKDGDDRRTDTSRAADPRGERGRTNKTDNPRRATAASAAAGPAAGPSLSPARNPRVGRAAIGGRASTSGKNTAVISGTGMRRRP